MVRELQKDLSLPKHRSCRPLIQKPWELNCRINWNHSFPLVSPSLKKNPRTKWLYGSKERSPHLRGVDLDPFRAGRSPSSPRCTGGRRRAPDWRGASCYREGAAAGLDGRETVATEKRWRRWSCSRAAAHQRVRQSSDDAAPTWRVSPPSKKTFLPSGPVWPTP